MLLKTPFFDHSFEALSQNYGKSCQRFLPNLFHGVKTTNLQVDFSLGEEGGS